MKQEYNEAIRTAVKVNGETVYVPFGEGIEQPDDDNIYCHRWKDALYYKFPEDPGAGFLNLIDPPKMYLSELAEMSESDALKALETKEGRLHVTEDLVRFNLAVGNVPFLHGPPGHAKTSFFESFALSTDANGRNYNVESEELSQVDQTIINGIHYVDPGDLTMKRSIPEVAKRILAMYREYGALTVYLMDEYTLASAGQQGATLRVTTHGEMGGISVKKYVAIGIAGNPKATVKSAGEILESAVNRSFHFSYIMDRKVWEPRWRRAFVPDGEERDPEREPDSDSKKFVRLLLDNHPRGVEPFNNSESAEQSAKAWTEENMLPKRGRELSPRTLTYFMKVYPLLRDLCRELGLSNSVLNVYLARESVAVFGQQWTDAVRRTLAQMDSFFDGYSEIADRLSAVSFGDESLPSYISQLLYRSDNTPLDTAELTAVFDDAKRIVERRSSTAADMEEALTVLWCCAVAAQTSHPSLVPVTMNHLADMAQFLSNNRDKLSQIAGGRVSAAFVSAELKAQLQQTVAERGARQA